MEAQSFKAREMVNGTEVITLEVDGVLDITTADILQNTLQDLIMKRNKNRIILNLANLSYISSAGVGVLMHFIHLARKKGGDIILTHIHSEIQHVFELLDLDRIFQVLKTQQDAVKAFGEQRYSQS